MVSVYSLQALPFSFGGVALVTIIINQIENFPTSQLEDLLWKPGSFPYSQLQSGAHCDALKQNISQEITRTSLLSSPFHDGFHIFITTIYYLKSKWLLVTKRKSEGDVNHNFILHMHRVFWSPLYEEQIHFYGLIISQWRYTWKAFQIKLYHYILSGILLSNYARAKLQLPEMHQ